MSKYLKNTNLSYNSVLTYYFLENILIEISRSKHSNYFIFKGGFLISSVIGVYNRTTIDIDFIVKNLELSEDKILEVFNEIFNDSKREIFYEIKKVEPIRDLDSYGGFRISVLCKFENIKVNVPLDIATGDPITPNEIKYNYTSIFSGEDYEILSYNIETILAEKLETIFIRGVQNSRSKDLYDIYMIFKLNENELDYKLILEACKNTFSYRNTELDITKFLSRINELRNNSFINSRWDSYKKQQSYTKDLDLNEVLNAIEKLLQKLVEV